MSNIKLQLNDKEKEIVDSELTDSKNIEWEQRLKIIELLYTGYSISEIATKFNKSENTIRKYIKKFTTGIRLTKYSIKKLEFVICIKNDDYPESLKIMKVYQKIFDDKAIKHKLIRVMDETGEDYLYPQSYFVPISDAIKLGVIKLLAMGKQNKYATINKLSDM